MELGTATEPYRNADDGFNILMVCTANICRSPGAERLLALELSQRELADAFIIKISSAGVRGWDNSPMDRDATAALEARGGSAKGFASRPLTEQIVADAHLILTATKGHRSELVERFPRSLRYTFTMKEFAGLATSEQSYESARDLVAAAYAHRGGASIADLDVADPYGGTAHQHVMAMTEIGDSMSVVADALARCESA